MLLILILVFVAGALFGNTVKNAMVKLFNAIKAKLSLFTASSASTATPVASDQKTPPTPPSV